MKSVKLLGGKLQCLFKLDETKKEIQDECLLVLNINFKLRFRFQGFSCSFNLIFEFNLQFHF
jgi:hypothetical protein